MGHLYYPHPLPSSGNMRRMSELQGGDGLWQSCSQCCTSQTDGAADLQAPPFTEELLAFGGEISVFFSGVAPSIGVAFPGWAPGPAVVGQPKMNSMVVVLENFLSDILSGSFFPSLLSLSLSISLSFFLSLFHLSCLLLIYYDFWGKKCSIIPKSKYQI